MSLLVYSCFALPLWCALFALYFILRRHRLLRESLVAKCAGSFLSVTSAGLALHLQGSNPFSSPVFWFFLLCTVADAVLELQFVAGMLLFGVAHVCLAVWLWSGMQPPWWALLFWAAAYGITAFLFRRELPRLGKLTVPFCLYPALLAVSLALGLAMLFLGKAGGWMLALGTLCFYVSDMMVARQELSKLDDWYQKPVMFLYWLALYLISAAVW